MQSFNDIFDVRTLDEHELGHLEYVLNSPSYARIFRPYLERIRGGLIHRLLDPSTERKDHYPDDYLRGGVSILDGLSAFFDKLVEETQIARMQAARAASPEAEYLERVRSGEIGPAGQVAPEEY